MKKVLKKIPAGAYFIVSVVILLVVLVFAASFYLKAQGVGEMIGQTTGMLAGRAIGSIEGLTVGRADGQKAGKEAGLNAEDTTVMLSMKIKEVERLQVLVASGTFSDVLKIGSDYAALLSQKYNAVFTVDLSTGEYELRGDGFYIRLDQPTVEFLPIGELVKENEYQQHGFHGSAEDGFDATNNAAGQMKQKATERLAGDMSLMEAARNSAITQLVQLVGAVSLSQPEVIVEFRELGG